jgi:hypothetical protein
VDFEEWSAYKIQLHGTEWIVSLSADWDQSPRTKKESFKSFSINILKFSRFQLDWRVRPLVIFIKSWAKLAGINDAKDQTLSSYTLTLMVVHYLQAGVEPPVLPSLQNLYPSTFGSYASFAQFSFLRDLPSYQSQNTMSLGTGSTIERVVCKKKKFILKQF